MSKLTPKAELTYLKLVAQREGIEDQIDQLLNPAKATKKAAKKAAKKVATRRNDPPAPTNRKLAIVVGHTRVAPGASGISPINQSEYVWNTDLAAQITAAGTAAGITVKTFFRDVGGVSGAYAAVSQWGAGAAIELHFNAANGAARGTETLYGNVYAPSLGWATAVQAAMVRLYNRGAGLPGNRGLKRCPPHPRGGASVNALSNIPSCLIEPFFGDHPGDAALGQTNKSGLAAALVAAFKTHFGL